MVQGDPQQTEYQRQTAENTGKMDDFINSFLASGGGPLPRGP